MMISHLNLRLVVVGTVALLTSRALSVFIVSIFVNICKKERIPFSHQIVMTYGGLRGAVAFYLALNLHTQYKDVLITITGVLIMITVVGLGSTTNCVLKLLNCCCPQDKIIQEEETSSLMEDELRSDGNRSDGLVTKLEYLDLQFGQKFLRKNAGVLGVDHGSEVEFDQEDDSEVMSAVSRVEDAMEDFFNRDVRGGDLSPYRKFTLRFRKKEAELL